MNCLKRQRAWASYLAKIHQGLEAAGVDRDFFSVDDLRRLAACRYSAERVIELAVRNAKEKQPGAPA